MVSGNRDHTVDEIRTLLRNTDVAVIATASGEHIRQRTMHLGFEEDFSIYLASMHNDPKILQFINHPHVSILVLRRDGPITESEEVEYTGRAILLKDPADRERCLQATARTSPVVQALAAQNQTSVLDCIQIVPETIKYRKFNEIVKGTPPTVLEFPHHQRAADDLAQLRMKLGSWWTAIRVNSLTASLVPVLVGTAAAWAERGRLNLVTFLVTLLGGVLAQVAVNLMNDYYDHRALADEGNQSFVRPFSGGSRVIQLGLLTPLEVLVGAITAMVLAGVAGLYLTWYAGPLVLVLAAAGAVAILTYNRPHGFSLIRIGLGEASIGLSFGVFMVLGAYYVQAGSLSWAALAASFPVGLLITAIIYINEFPDAEADAKAGKPTLVVRWGQERALARLGWFIWPAFLFIVAGAFIRLFPPAALASLVGAPLAWRAITHAREHHADPVDMAPANAWVALTHLAVGLGLAVGYAGDALGVKGLPVTTVFAVLSVWFVWYMHVYTMRLMAASQTVRRAL